VYIDLMHNGAEEVFELGDRIRTNFYKRIGLEDLLKPALTRWVPGKYRNGRPAARVLP